MTFSFIHTADWHLGKRFGGFPAETRALLGEARFAAIDRIAEVAAKESAAHVLVAGDVFDDPRASLTTLRQAMARLAKHGEVTWHLLPGNHDADREGGVFQRAAADGLPENVRLLVEPRPVEIAPGVFLLPAPLKARALSSDPTAWMDKAATPEGAIRIGLAHGSIRSFGTSNDAAVPIDPARAKLAGLAFLALGDWHGTLKIDNQTWYSGTPEPDRFMDNDSGNILAVRCQSASAPATVERVPAKHFHWTEEALDGGKPGGFETWIGQQREKAMPADRQLIRLHLTGSVSLNRRSVINDALERLGASLRHLETDVENLTLRVEDDDLASLSSEHGFADLAARLTAEMAKDQPEAAVAKRALALLLDLARAAEAA